MKPTITPTPQMQRAITQLAKQHGLDLTVDEAYMRLDLPGYDRLSIERVGPNQLSVAHYFEQNRDLIANPEIVFFTGSVTWTPIAISQSLTGWREVAWLTEDCRRIDRLIPIAHKEVAKFAELWARNLAAQGWLHAATLTRIQTRPAEIAQAVAE